MKLHIPEVELLQTAAEPVPFDQLLNVEFDDGRAFSVMVAPALTEEEHSAPQFIPALFVTVPVPDPLLITLIVTGGAGGGVVENLASTNMRLSIMKEHGVAFKLHIAPAGDPDTTVQPAKLDPDAGMAVILTCELGRNPVALVNPLSTVCKVPVARLNVAFPGPDARNVSMEGGSNAAEICEFAVNTNLQGPVPVQVAADPVPDCQPTKVWSGAGVAMSVTVLFGGTGSVHVAGG